VSGRSRSVPSPGPAWAIHLSEGAAANPAGIEAGSTRNGDWPVGRTHRPLTIATGPGGSESALAGIDRDANRMNGLCTGKSANFVKMQFVWTKIGPVEKKSLRHFQTSKGFVFEKQDADIPRIDDFLKFRSISLPACSTKDRIILKCITANRLHKSYSQLFTELRLAHKLCRGNIADVTHWKRCRMMRRGFQVEPGISI